MPTVNQVNKQVKMDQWNIVKFQLAVHCHIKNIIVSDLDLNCLTLLALTGEKTLGQFCEIASSNKIFSCSQSVRNAINKAEKKELIIKKGSTRKKVALNIPNIQTEGNILLNYKICRIEPTNQESVPQSIAENS